MPDDSHLQQAVLDELSWDPSVTAAHIGVTANDGVVTLTGHVESFAERYAAELAVRRVKGVTAVAENIAVQIPFERSRGDDAIAAAAVERLAWDVSVPPEAVMVKVENGWVTLSGKVDWFYQKDAAAQDIRRLSGVVGISNQIIVTPRLNAMNISDNIEHALHRSWFFNPSQIKVSAVGGKITLSGTVHAPHDREVASVTAWAAPGVSSVQNDIAIA